VQQLFAELIAEAKAAGQTIVISSHVLPEVQQLADRVCLLREGRVALLDTVERLRGHAPARIVVTLDAPPPEAALRSVPGVRELARQGATITFALDGEPDELSLPSLGLGKLLRASPSLSRVTGTTCGEERTHRQCARLCDSIANQRHAHGCGRIALQVAAGRGQMHS
jgi:ABC-type multidrug transport system ATPase subunit